MKKYNKTDNTAKLFIVIGILILVLSLILTVPNKNYNATKRGESISYKEQKMTLQNLTSEPFEENKIYFINNISILTPNKIADDYSLQMDKLKVHETLSKYIGKNTDYFILYLSKGDKKLNLKNTSMTMTIKIDNNRKFEGIYKIINEKEVECLPYYKREENMIEVEIQELGRYAVKYEEEVIDFKDELIAMGYNLNNENTWSILLVILLILGTIYYIVTTIRHKLRVRDY